MHLRALRRPRCSFTEIPVPEPIFPGIYHPPGRKRELSVTRVRRRARELARISYQIYLEEILRELAAGRLQAELIEHYTPEHIAALPWQKQLLRAGR